jgi:pimeloyl-ACP methyl ester carboxylesterase
VLRPVAEFIDAYRIWFKVTFQRGRILLTRSDAWEAYDSERLYAEPELFYSTDGHVPEVGLAEEEATALAAVSRFSFPTPSPIGSYDGTNRVSGRLYRNTAREDAPVVVLSHGWAHRGVRALEVLFVEPLLREGFSVALPYHPFHFDRTPLGTFSGELMVTGDVVLTVEAFRQAAADTIALVNWLKASGQARVGLMGYSLGGYIAGLVACLREDLDFVVIGAAGESVISPILETGLGVNVREDLSRTGMSGRERLERAWGIISPGRLRLRVAAEKVLLVAGLYDRIMLRSSVGRLAGRWTVGVSWAREGHYTLLAMPGGLVRRSTPFMRSRVR